MNRSDLETTKKERDAKTYFIRSSLAWSDPWGELTGETGIICYVEEPHLKVCYELLKKKTIKEIRGHDLLITIGFVHGDGGGDGDRLCDIIYSTLKCYDDFDGKDLSVIDKDVDFSNFTFEMQELIFDGATFKPYE